MTSIRPTATLTNSQGWLPTTIVADPTSFTYTRPTVSPTDATSSALPSDIPLAIYPDDADKPQPPGTKEIQIGFLYALNYEHVAHNYAAAGQIFKYLPISLADAGNFGLDSVIVTKLIPLDTRDRWGYVTTIAKLYYPENMLDALQMDLWAPNSAIYNNENGIVNDLTAVINPQIDIFGNINGDGTDTSNPDDNDGGEDNNNDAFDSGNSDKSSGSQIATTAGIAVGAVALAGLYGAAMFVVARRYKRKRQGHRRASSMQSGSQASSDMQYAGNGSPALMGGALMSQDYSQYSYGGVAAGGRDSHGSGRSNNNSARTANISAPVATENSLGWN